MDTAIAPPQRLSLVTDDLDPIVAAVTRLFGHHVVLACGVADGDRMVQAAPLAAMLVGDLRYASSFICVADQPRGQLILTVPRDCSGLAGAELYQPGDVLAFNPAWVGRLELTAPGHFSNTCIPLPQLRLGMQALFGFEPDEVPLLADRLAGGSDGARHVLQVLELLRQSPRAPAGVQRAREMWAVMELLSFWPHSHSRYLYGQRPAPRAIRRALEYIDAHLEQPLSLAEVGRAAHLGVKALTEGFRGHLGETPARYIRARRLEAARSDLRAGGAVTVMDVATRWNFSNPGQFAQYYRQRFGHLPSQERRISAARSRPD